jgi:crotonobetainyl-CoA:carnitine CoA-transferase CaiB-like acyl-CoA transferase
LFASDAFRALDWTQTVSRANGATMHTTRCPIRIDGALLKSDKASPAVGEQSESIRREFGLIPAG